MTDLNHRHLWSEERRRQWYGIPKSLTGSSSSEAQKGDGLAPVIRAGERGKKWNLVASTAFEHTRGQDPNISTWNLLGTCCKSKHNYRHGCCAESIGCQGSMTDGLASSVSQVKDSEESGEIVEDPGLNAEVESELQLISCAICGKQGTGAACSGCTFRVCEWCMNPSGKCVECQNPWGNLTSNVEDEFTDTDVEAFQQCKRIKEEEVGFQE